MGLEFAREGVDGHRSIGKHRPVHCVARQASKPFTPMLGAFTWTRGIYNMEMPGPSNTAIGGLSTKCVRGQPNIKDDSSQPFINPGLLTHPLFTFMRTALSDLGLQGGRAFCTVRWINARKKRDEEEQRIDLQLVDSAIIIRPIERRGTPVRPAYGHPDLVGRELHGTPHRPLSQRAGHADGRARRTRRKSR